MRSCHREGCEGWLNDANAKRCVNCGKERFLGTARLIPIRERTEDLIGQFYDIDPKKLSEEKDKMLAAIRRAR
jgi:hypothetical protein